MIAPDDLANTTVVSRLVDDAARSLAAWIDHGPNDRAAASAALTEITAAIQLLSRARRALIADVNRVVAGRVDVDLDEHHRQLLRGGWGLSGPGPAGPENRP